MCVYIYIYISYNYTTQYYNIIEIYNVCLEWRLNKCEKE